MLEYEYKGLAEKKKPNKSIVLFIFLCIVLVATLVGVIIGYPQAVCLIIFYPLVNAICSEKSIPCQVRVKVANNGIEIMYKNVLRDGHMVDELYVYPAKRIRRIYWIKQKEKIGVCGYPYITVFENSKIIEQYDCRVDKVRKRTYIHYESATLNIKANIIVR